MTNARKRDLAPNPRLDRTQPDSRRGIIIRVSGVRVPPPASTKAPLMRGFACLEASARRERGTCKESPHSRRELLSDLCADDLGLGKALGASRQGFFTRPPYRFVWMNDRYAAARVWIEL
jgi:hypothetical protein